MRIRLAFHQAVDERFLVMWENLHGSFTGGQGTFAIVPYEDENDFIQQVVMADLRHDDTVSIIAGVLLALARRSRPEEHWIPLTLKPEQMSRLGLLSSAMPIRLGYRAPSESPKEAADLHDVMMQTPTPFVVLAGPEHRITFINPAYVDIMRRPDVQSVLGKTIREALPELVGQPFFALLNEVYLTGIEYIGRAIPGKLRNSTTGQMENHYFDFIYYPVRDNEGCVCGIMAQATDVTANVLECQVAESREEQLYKQWAELDNIYRYSPMGMAMIDARTFRILRLNALTAEQLGDSAENLVGKVMTDLVPELTELPHLYNLVAKGEVVRNYELVLELPPHSGVKRAWLLTLSPLFDEAGNVDRIESVAAEITDRTGLRLEVLVGAAIASQ